MRTNTDALLRRVDSLSREIERLRRDILRVSSENQPVSKRRKSLFGSVSAEEITDKMITQAQKNLFRELSDM